MLIQKPTSFFGIRYFNYAGPTDYVVQYRGGKRVFEGKGVSFFSGPRTTAAIIPTDVQAIPFAYTEHTSDDQTIVVTGEVRAVFDTAKAMDLYDFSVYITDGRYRKDGLRSAHESVQNALRQLVRSKVGQLPLKDTLHASGTLQQELTEIALNENSNMAVLFKNLGVDIQAISVNSITPDDDEVSEAVGAPERERLLSEADRAAASRREVAAEDDRRIRRYEAETDKQLAEDREELVTTEGKNRILEAESEAEALEKTLTKYRDVNPAVLMAMGIKEMANGRIGQINFTPELLSAINQQVNR